jgi:hypothetical protein
LFTRTHQLLQQKQFAVHHSFRVIVSVEEDAKGLSIFFFSSSTTQRDTTKHPSASASTYTTAARQGGDHRAAAMCRVEYTFFTCGHTSDHSVDCELAQSFGPLFNRTGCVNYDFSSTHSQLQCGRLMGFYCAKTQNGTIIEKSQEALDRMFPDVEDRNVEKNRICAAWNSYREQNAHRGHSLDSLVSVPTYRNIDHQRQLLIDECNGLEHRRLYLNNLIAHAYKNRNMLAPGVMYQPLWSTTSFDFDATIFTPQMLDPIRRQLPGQAPAPIVPAVRSTANAMNQQQQHSHPQQGIGLPPIANFGMTAAPLQQTRFTPQQMGFVTPKRQTEVTDERSPIGEDIVRGHNPEGETREEKAVRYRDQLKAAAARRMTEAMAKEGYNVQEYGVSPAAKVAGL